MLFQKYIEKRISWVSKEIVIWCAKYLIWLGVFRYMYSDIGFENTVLSALAVIIVGAPEIFSKKDK